MLLQYLSSFPSPFIAYLIIQVYLTIFYTYFHYPQITVPPSNQTSQGPILHSHSSMTHTKTSITIIPRYSNILILAYPIHHLCNFIPSTPIPMTPNFNRMHSFLHQAPTDPQHPLNHEKHSLCIVTNVAWRPASRRQAVHQFWNFPDSCTAPTRLQISSTSRNFTIRTSLK